jgi:putative DNA primase/helicase
MTLEAVLARLRGVRRNGSAWQALCPAHADRNPSLSISEQEGTILVHCHAGCSQEAVLAAAGIEARGLFGDSYAHARIVAEYSYLDERGEQLFQVVRYEPKGFRQRRSDGMGGWLWNLHGTRRVLYRLPEILAEKSLLICEGEKDCETARALGIVATCNAGGAGKWREEYSEHLHEKQIIIIADADEPGRKHAETVSASLQWKAPSIKVLELPGAKDLSEWVEHGGARDALLELIRNAPERKSTTQVTGGFILTPLADLLARPDIPVEYIVENLLVAGTVACIVAKPKVGKSTFARNLCLSVSRGVDFLGLKTKQGECIYLALEEREEDLKNDFRAMGADGTEPVYTYAAAAPAEGIDAACDLVRQRRPVLVVIDPLFRLARIKDEKAYAETYAALGPLIDVAREVGTLVVLVHHAGKSVKADAIDSPLGSTAIGGAVCTVVLLKKQTESGTRTIQTVPRIGQEMPETVLRFDPASRSLSLGARKDEADVQAAEEAILEYLKSMGEPKTEPEIDEAVEGKTGLKRKALRALATHGKITREGCGKRGDPYKYAFLFSCSQDIAGTREQETENGRQAIEKKDRISCSQDSQDSILVPAPSEQQKRFEEGEL